MITYRANPSFNSYFGFSGSTLLDYSLKPMKNALGFQIHTQHPMLTEFLKTNKFRATNGIVIDVSVKPEIVESMKDGDFIIYLRGNNSKYDSKVDITRFVGELQRDGHKKAIEKALGEFVQYVKSSTRLSSYGTNWGYGTSQPANCICW